MLCLIQKFSSAAEWYVKSANDLIIYIRISWMKRKLFASVDKEEL